jgi:hypothetical protein
MVSAADPPRSLISVFFNGAATFLWSSSSFILTRAEWTPFQTHCYSETLTTRPQGRSKYTFTNGLKQIKHEVFWYSMPNQHNLSKACSRWIIYLNANWFSNRITWRKYKMFCHNSVVLRTENVEVCVLLAVLTSVMEALNSTEHCSSKTNTSFIELISDWILIRSWQTTCWTLL